MRDEHEVAEPLVEKPRDAGDDPGRCDVALLPAGNRIAAQPGVDASYEAGSVVDGWRVALGLAAVVLDK